MNARVYLEQYKMAEIELQTLEDKSDMLKQSVRNPKGIDYSKEQGSPSIVNSTEQIILKYIEIEKDIDLKKLELIRLRDEIVNDLRRLQDTRYFQVLYLRHIKRKRFWEIAKIMEYEESHVRGYLYTRAIDELEKLIQINTK